MMAIPAPVLDTFVTVIESVPPEQLRALPRPEGPKGYSRTTLARDLEKEVAAARWRAGGQCKLHGHDGSAALYVVVRGVLREERYLPDGDGYRYEVATLRPGDRNYLPAGSYHRLRALEDAVTVHIYLPPADNPTTVVPPETLRLLRRAKRQALRRRPGPTRRAPGIVEAVRRLADGWAERETLANHEGRLTMPPETLAEMRSSGILAAPLPERYGGWGSTLAETAQAVRLLAQRAPAAALALVMPLGNAATTRVPAGCVPTACRAALWAGQCWIADRVREGKILAVANSEPGAGGDLRNTRTTATPGAGGTYHLTGRKSFATFGRDADYFLCAARRSEADPGGTHDVIDGFFVRRDAPGLTVDDRWNPVGMRPTASVGLTLEGAPAEALLGYPGCLEGVNARHWSTVLFAAVFVGVGEGALREGARQTSAEAVWARAALAEQALHLEAAAGFVEAVAGAETWPVPAELQERSRLAKTFAARAAVEAATHAAMVAGGRCYTPHHPVFLFLCDALAGPLLRPPLPQSMDALVRRLFPPAPPEARALTA
jgi:alkylation response protein AidB-like acyl-CoA dehydrogenase